MKEFEILLKAFADGLKSMAQGINVLAGKVDQLAREQSGDRDSMQKERKKAEPKTARRKPATPGKTAKAPKADALNATETVLQALRQSAEPVSNAALAEQTGFDRKKVSSILSKLKKRGMIKSVDKGMYVAQ
jgi:predicted HTH transcriptional regulator